MDDNFEVQPLITPLPASPRRRGGQRGNHNARTHGFYSRAFPPCERELFEAAKQMRGLGDEITLLRMKILSIMLNDPENHALLVLAVSALTRALRVQQQIEKDSPEGLEKPVENVLRRVALPMGLAGLVDKINGEQDGAATHQARGEGNMT